MLFPFSFMQSQYDPNAQAFFNRVTEAGGTLSDTEKTAVNTLVLDLKANSLWSSMKAIYPMVGGGTGTTAARQAACEQNLVSASFTGTFTSGWTFTSSGAKPNGTSAYMDTNLIWNTNTSLNNGALGSYWTDYTATATNKYYGAYDASGVLLINHKDINGDNYINSFSAVNANSGNGLHALSRISSSEIVKYQNTSNTVGSSTSTTQPIGLPVWFGGVSGLTNFGYQPWNIAMGFITDGFTNTTWSNFYTIVQAFQTTLSRQV
jgi:hypothetical protein